jgi:hypothetical protein
MYNFRSADLPTITMPFSNTLPCSGRIWLRAPLDVSSIFSRGEFRIFLLPTVLLASEIMMSLNPLNCFPGGAHAQKNGVSTSCFEGFNVGTRGGVCTTTVVGLLCPRIVYILTHPVSLVVLGGTFWLNITCHPCTQFSRWALVVVVEFSLIATPLFLTDNASRSIPVA